MDSPKYNRTFHVPWSPGGTNDDKRAEHAVFVGLDIVITEKMDGSNTSLETDACYARTHSGPPNHPSFDALKAMHATIKHKIPSGFQLFGEWCYAQHSIAYNELPGYFMLFNVRDLTKTFEGQPNPSWLSWDEVEMWAEEIGVPTVPVLYKGKVWSEDELRRLTNSFMNQPSMCGGIREGVVIRLASEFVERSFDYAVLKCVRANHVQTTEHWKDQEITKNKLKI
jgi:hypothetical protein